jgi:hypothetical protein
MHNVEELYALKTDVIQAFGLPGEYVPIEKPS